VHREVVEIVMGCPNVIGEDKVLGPIIAKEVMTMTDRRAGRVPHVPSRGGSKQPRARRQDGAWRKKRSDAGKPRASKPASLFGWLFK
jgi:hypothetical protein